LLIWNLIAAFLDWFDQILDPWEEWGEDD